MTEKLGDMQAYVLFLWFWLAFQSCRLEGQCFALAFCLRSQSRVHGLLHDSFCRSRCPLMPLSGFYAWSYGLLLCSVSPTHVPVRNSSQERVSVMGNGVLRRRTHEADQKQKPKVSASSRRDAGFTMWGLTPGFACRIQVHD